MANQFLGLSMFIMLLSFFIVLNSLSNFEIKKSSPILNSLSLAFSTEDREDRDAPSKAAQTTEALRKGTTMDKLQGLFETEITGIEATQNRLGTVMHIRMSFEEFEKQTTTGLVKSNTGEPRQSIFVPTLISLLDAKENGTMTKMKMMVNLRSAPALALANNDSQLPDISRRISRIAGVLEQAGLEKKLLETGLKGGDDGMVDLFFLRYEPFNPLLNKIREGT